MEFKGAKMSDSQAQIDVIAASDIEVDRETLDNSIKTFADKNGPYYVSVFGKIHDTTNAIPNST